MSNWIMAVMTSILLLTGLSQEVSPCRVVTAITVEWEESGVHRRQHYEDPADMDRLLHYLRALRPFQLYDEPENIPQRIYHITVTCSDGSQVRYAQAGLQYLKKEDGHWEKLNPERAIRLPLLLAAIPGTS